jgi:phosphate transport system substrate-binding protein
MQMQGGWRRSVVVRSAFYTTPVLLVAIVGLLYLGSGTQSSNLQTGSVQVVGSETMRPVVTACAEEFMARNPQADIVVKGGGSGDGIAAVLHGVVDLGMTSRDLSSRERDYAASRGIEISAVGLALDGITVVVNRANAVAASWATILMPRPSGICRQTKPS